MGFDDKALAVAAMIITMNAVLMVGFAHVGIDFSKDNMFTWIDSAVLEKGELVAKRQFENPAAANLDVNLAVSSTEAGGTASDTQTTALVSKTIGAAASIFPAIQGALIGHLYVMEFLDISPEIQFILGVPMSVILTYGLFTLLKMLASAVGSFFIRR